jgi:hypothetical protein
MLRFYFDLRGELNVRDPGGFLFDSDLVAFRAGQQLAAELAEVRPVLHGNTCVIVSPKSRHESYCVSI